MLIISYGRVRKIGVWELVPGQGSVTKYLDERGGVILSSMSIVHCAIDHSVPGYVVILVLGDSENHNSTTTNYHHVRR